jgi:hypothetical protein
MLTYKDLSLVSVINTTSPTLLGSVDLQDYAKDLYSPLGINQAVRLTYYGTFYENYGVGTPGATLTFSLGGFTDSQDIYIPAGSTSWKAVIDVVVDTIPGTALLSHTYLVGDQVADPGDNRVGMHNSVGSFAPSDYVATLTGQLSAADPNLRIYLLGFTAETL